MQRYETSAQAAFWQKRPLPERKRSKLRGAHARRALPDLPNLGEIFVPVGWRAAELGGSQCNQGQSRRLKLSQGGFFPLPTFSLPASPREMRAQTGGCRRGNFKGNADQSR